MARIEYIDQSLRDGQQSLWGMRMHAGHILPIADAVDSAGYRVVDLTGSSLFEVLIRFRQEDPWRGLDAVRTAMPNTVLRAGTRSNGVVGMGITFPGDVRTKSIQASHVAVDLSDIESENLDEAIGVDTEGLE